MVRARSVAPRAADIENPKLMIALIAVMDAQTMNGRVIRPPAARSWRHPSQTAPPLDNYCRRATGDTIRLVADHDCVRLAANLTRLRNSICVGGWDRLWPGSALDSMFVAFPFGKPVSTFPGNALAHPVRRPTRFPAP